MNFLVFFPVIFVMELFQSIPQNTKNVTIQNVTQPHPLVSISQKLQNLDLDPGLAAADLENDDDDDDQEHSKHFKTTEELTTDFRRSFIRQMTLESLQKYQKFQKATNKTQLPDSTLVSSMSTLWAMSQAEPLGLVHEEFYRTRNWIDTKLSFTGLNLKDAKVAELVNRFVGSLLSCYALTGDRMYLMKAEQIMGQLGTGSDQDLGNQRLELKYLSDLTGNSKYWDAVKGTGSDLKKVKEDRLLKSKDRLMVLAKSFTQSHRKSPKSLKLFKDAIDHFDRDHHFQSAGEVCVTSPEHQISLCRPGLVYLEGMGARDCNLGAMFALGADSLMKSLSSIKRSILKKSGTGSEIVRIARYWELAEQLTETCRLMTNKSTFGLTPEVFTLPNGNAVDELQEGKGHGIISAELAESYFILWRLTHQLKYREYAWELAQSAYRSLRLRKNLEPELISTTLKYLYLIFSPDHLLPLDQWVFTSAGQPLPVLCGRKSRCVL